MLKVMTWRVKELGMDSQGWHSQLYEPLNTGFGARRWFFVLSVTKEFDTGMHCDIFSVCEFKGLLQNSKKDLKEIEEIIEI